MAKRKKQGNLRKQVEERYWAVETAKFRIKEPKAFRENRTRTKIAKMLFAPLNQWKKSRENAVAKWAALENYLLSGKMKPEKLYKMLNSTQEAVKETLELEEKFLKNRARTIEKLTDKIDWNALQRIYAMEDKKAEINVERLFFGDIRKLGTKGVLEKFAELVTVMNVGNDAVYKKLKQRIAGTGIGIQRLEKRENAYITHVTKQYTLGKIDEWKFLRENLLLQYTSAYQYFNLTQASEKLYARLEMFAKDKKLKKLLGVLGREMKRRKLMYMSEKARIEFEFRKKDSKL